jgi:hypothetical protein
MRGGNELPVVTAGRDMLIICEVTTYGLSVGRAGPGPYDREYISSAG